MRKRFFKETDEKILSFKFLEKGWYFGEGVPCNDNIIKKARLLNREASKHGFIKTNAFPGIDGEIQVTIYFLNHYLEFIIELNETITFVHEKDDIEIEYKEGLSFEEAKNKISESLLHMNVKIERIIDTV